MDLRKLTFNMSVAPQIAAADMAPLAAAGFRTIIDNRPDAEIAFTLGSAAMADAAASAGLRFHYLPIMPGQLDAALAEAFARLVEASEGAVLAYCRSGTRSATAWALGQAGRIPAAQILRLAAEAGYDLSPMAGLLSGPGRRSR